MSETQEHGQSTRDPRLWFHAHMTDDRTVLYVEDNAANLRLVAHILARVPRIRMITAHTPALGIELARVHRPALILLDINLPGMDGYQVLEVLKSEPSLKDTPVIAVTANAMSRDIERGRAAGFVNYLIKPFDVVEFLDVVQRCIVDAEDPGDRDGA